MNRQIHREIDHAMDHISEALKDYPKDVNLLMAKGMLKRAVENDTKRTRRLDNVVIQENG